MEAERVRLLAIWLKTAVLTLVTVQRVYRVVQPTPHAQMDSVAQQATVFVRTSPSSVRPAAATVSVTPVLASMVSAAKVPVGEFVRPAREVKRGRPTVVVRPSLQAVTLTMNVHDRMLHPVVRPGCVMAREPVLFIPHPRRV